MNLAPPQVMDWGPICPVKSNKDTQSAFSPPKLSYFNSNAPILPTSQTSTTLRLLTPFDPKPFWLSLASECSRLWVSPGQKGVLRQASADTFCPS